MTPHGIVQRATKADADECSKSLRMEDRRELEEITGLSAYDCLYRGVLMGSPSLSLRTHGGDLVAILSVIPFGTRTGVIALSGTKAIEENRTSFLRGSRDVLVHLDTKFDTLVNICDARNTVHLRWLEWLGFTFIRKIDSYGPVGVPVIEFARIRKCANH